MNANFRFIVSITMMGIAFALADSSQAGIIVTPPRVIISPPPVVVSPIPASYIWDGREFVGMVGSQYYSSHSAGSIRHAPQTNAFASCMAVS